MNTLHCLKFIWLVIIAVVSVVCSLTALGDEITDAKAQLAQEVNSLGSLHPWDVIELSPAQIQSIDHCKKCAIQLVNGPNYALNVTSFVDRLKDQDGYARQALIYALTQRRNYTVEDLQFLRSVLIAAMHFHYDAYPRRVRNWLTAYDIQIRLADLVLSVNGHGEMVGKGDYRLLIKDLLAWLTKYAP